MKKRILPLLLCFLLLFSACHAPRELSSEEKLSDTETLSEESANVSDLSKPIEEKPSTEEETVSEENEFLLCAYLPINALESVEDVSQESLATLDYLVLNTGVYWDENGNLSVDDSLPQIIEQLSAHVPIVCTVNPMGKLIREGSVLSTIDTAEKREKLISEICSFAQEHSLFGIDIDWEFPKENEWDAFRSLLQELKQELDEKALSLAFYPENIDLPTTCFDSIDRVHIMAYDLFDENGFHSTFETAQNSIDYFINLGFEPQQLSLGIPAYGRPLDASAKWIFYRDADPSLLSEENLVGDIFFNSRALASQKVKFAQEENLGGAMLYHLLCDREDEFSLLSAMKESIAQPK